MAVKAATLLAAAQEEGLFTAEQMAGIVLRARRERLDTLELACMVGAYPPSAFYQALARHKGLPFLPLGRFEPLNTAMKKLPVSLLQRGHLAPVATPDGEFLLTADPDDHAAHDMARRLLGSQMALAMAEPEAIASMLNRWLAANRGADDVADALAAERTDHVKLLDAIFKRGFLARASDIHIEGVRDGYRVRYRVDGRLQDSPHQLSTTEGAGLISRIKVLAGLDIAESRVAQDGGMSYLAMKDVRIDVRVATLPTRFGERATLRLMGVDRRPLTLTDLGMSEAMLAQFRLLLRQSHGIVLITGPTGSGKSTTLYAALAELIDPEINVLTVEDPVERPLAGASQVQVDVKMGFANTLRAFLRHDPDVIMLGEVRDLDTADVALKAAVTGHLVFSTLHTNSAPAAVTRLADLGVARFLIAATLRAVVAQRLVRRLCASCRTARPASDQERALLRLPAGAVLWEPAGCPACAGTGYRGRVGIFEALWIDAELPKFITGSAPEHELRRHAQHFTSLWEDGRRKVSEGVTTLAELVSVASPEETD